MRYLQIVEIKNALTELGKERLPIAYEVAKNIRLCNTYIQETQDINKELVERFCDKDEDGKPKQYPVEDHPEQSQIRITDSEALKQYQAEWLKTLEAEHDINFIKIPKTRFQSEKLSANIMVPLIDVIIQE